MKDKKGQSRPTELLALHSVPLVKCIVFTTRGIYVICLNTEVSAKSFGGFLEELGSCLDRQLVNIIPDAIISVCQLSIVDKAV